MKRRPVDQLVYESMMPRPKQSDPTSFHGILTRHLVFEVRQEVHSFYGHISTEEARYPGLDYCHPVHRIRLSRWPWHRRLFRAFDALQLTPSEIASLTKWEGTKWAKERFEKEQGITIHDTAADGLPDWREHGSRWRAAATASGLSLSMDGFQQQQGLDASIVENTHMFVEVEAAEQDENDGDDDEDDDSDMEIESIGLQLNERLLERVAAHNAGDMSQPLDEDWEQWLKNAIEAGNLSLVTDHTSAAPVATSAAPTTQTTIAGAGAADPSIWDELPDYVRDTFREVFHVHEATPPPAQLQASASPATSAAPRQRAETTQRRTYSDLRLPTNRLA